MSSDNSYQVNAWTPWRQNILLRRAVDTMLQGGIIAYPTEAVWGLGCDPSDEQAVERILQLKHRSVDKGLILVAAHIDQFAPLLTDIDASQRHILAASWPGANTWLVQNNGLIPPWIGGQHTSVALRVSAHPVVAALSQRFGGPIVSTSANPQGRPSAKTAVAVKKYFPHGIDAMAPGQVGQHKAASAIRDLNSGVIIRGASEAR